jgi:hypothetical protein
MQYQDQRDLAAATECDAARASKHPSRRHSLNRVYAGSRSAPARSRGGRRGRASTFLSRPDHLSCIRLARSMVLSRMRPIGSTILAFFAGPQVCRHKYKVREPGQSSSAVGTEEMPIRPFRWNELLRVIELHSVMAASMASGRVHVGAGTRAKD